MVIDVLLALLVVIGAIRGFGKGLIVAVFTLLAYLVGLAAAMKFSHLAAEKLHPYIPVPDRWLPLIAFLLVLTVVILLVRWMAYAIQKLVEGLMLGWINRIGGMLFYCILYLTIYSILLFYLVKMHLIGQETLQRSVTYPYIAVIAPKIVGLVGLAIPWFRDIFARLDKFFDKVGP
jgi:membrane protein required for colicin V production